MMGSDAWTINGKQYPHTDPIAVRKGERVRVRLGNMSMEAHPMHLHGQSFRVLAVNGRRLDRPLVKDSVDVEAHMGAVEIELAAHNPGDWFFHCHKPMHMGHPNAFLKTFLEAGVPSEHAFTHAGSRRTLGDLVEGARALFRPHLVISEPNALPWSLIAFTRTTSPVRGRWTNAWGEPVDLDIVVESALQLLERASLPIAQAMRENRPEAAKAPVHAFTCAGTHMLYALLTAVHAGYVGADRLERVRRQVDLLVWRLGADVGLIERFYQERAGRNGVFWYEIDTKLKLLGHAEECLALGVKRGVAALTPAQQSRRRAAVRLVHHMLDEIERRDLDETKAIDRELFRQLIGDTCHARHGLTLT